MCGISGIVGASSARQRVEAMVRGQHHRGPDASGVYESQAGLCVLGHNRLSIIDLSDAGVQPMASADGRLHIVFNGEVYNYRELRDELGDYPFRSRTDTEVVLAAYERWGEACLDRFVGMFAFAVWDESARALFAARDRFGVKPLYFHEAGGTLLFASEIKALHAAGIEREPDAVAWATYLATGAQDLPDRTFWAGVRALPAGHALTWSDGVARTRRWYDVAERVGAEVDTRPEEAVVDEYQALLEESVRLRFRSDVPVGINVSGGLDSSVLLGLVRKVQGEDNAARAYTFVTGDPAYDETPWVEAMLAHTRHEWSACRLGAADVPALAEAVAAAQDEPFGGLPTLAYAGVFARARRDGVRVLLDGQGMDEQWCGYDYYDRVGSAAPGIVQGTSTSPVRPECLSPELRALAGRPEPPAPFGDRLRDLQYRDLTATKIPRALRFNDRVSMMHSTELREPFLDHRLVELAVRQPAERKLGGGTRKRVLRRIAARLVPETIALAPKRPVQTPQREWLRGPLAGWVEDQIRAALETYGDWLDASEVERAWRTFLAGHGDNSFFVWQWISLGLLARSRGRTGRGVTAR